MFWDMRALLWLYLPQPSHFGGISQRHRSPGSPSKPPFPASSTPVSSKGNQVTGQSSPTEGTF